MRVGRQLIGFVAFAGLLGLAIMQVRVHAAPPKPASKPKIGAAKPAESPRRETLLSVYVGNDPPDLVQFERWFGHKVDGFQLHTGNTTWQDWEGSIPWLLDRWKDVDREIFWSIPMYPAEGSMSDAGLGEYDARWEAMAHKLIDASPQRGRIYIRTGWEFNGDWMYWSAHGGNAPKFVQAYRRFVSAFRRVSGKFVFEWTPNIGDQGMNPELAYPGDQYVDIIGLDFYYNKKYDPKDGRGAWKFMLKRRYGLEWFVGFAARHKKPTAYAEWGVMSDDTAAYMRDAARWFSQHGPVYQSYWNSNASFQGKLSDDQFVQAGRAYREVFTPLSARHAGDAGVPARDAGQ